MEDYFANSKYTIQNVEDDEAITQDDTDQLLFEHRENQDCGVTFFASHPKQVLEDGSKIFNHRKFLHDLGVGSFSQTYCLSEVKQKDTLEITDETKSVQTFEDQSLAPKDKKIALRVYNTVNLVNQRKIDYETMEWTNNLQRLLTEVQL